MRITFTSLFVAALTMAGTAQVSDTQQSAELVPTLDRGTATQQTTALRGGGEEPTVIWSDDFATADNWEFGTTGETFGWFLTETAMPQSWSPALEEDVMSTSGAPYAELLNGDPFDDDGNFMAPPAGDFNLTTTNPIDVTGDWSGFVLEYEMFGAHFTDNLITRISTDGETFVDVSNVDDIEVFSTAGGGPTENTLLRRANISAELAEATQVWIQFNWNGTTTYGWTIDDIRIVEAQANDIRLVSGHRGDYINAWDPYLTPYSQITAQVFTANIENLGGETQTDMPVVFTVTDDAGAQVYTFTENITITPGEEAYVIAETEWTPNSLADVGVYTLTVTTPDDSSPADNMATEGLAISEFIYANGNVEPETYAERTFNDTFDGQEFAIGNRLLMNADGTIYGVEVNFGPDTNDGEEVTVRVIGGGDAINQGTFDTSTIVAEKDYTIPLEATYPGGVARVKFDSPVNVLAGVVYQVEVVKAFEGKMSIMSANDDDVDASTLNLGDFGNADPTFNWYVGWGWSPQLDLSFDPDFEEEVYFVGVEEENTAVIDLGQNFPNPATIETTINYTLAQAGKVAFEVYDITGKLVVNESLGQRGAGAQSYTLNLKGFEAGVYTYTMIVNGERSTKKMIVE